MKKLFMSAVIAMGLCTGVFAQENVDSRGFYLGGAVGTEGLGVELGYKISEKMDVRGRLSYMPGFKIPHKVHYKLPFELDGRTTTVYTMKGNIERFSGAVLFDWFVNNDFGLTVGGMFGGKTLVDVDGYNANLHHFLKEGHYFEMEICDRNVVIDKNGRVRWNMTTPFFRPYVGITLGRYWAHGIKMSMDIGVQYQGKMDLNIQNDNYESPYNSDNSGQWIRDVFVVYPVVNLRFSGKIF